MRNGSVEAVFDFGVGAAFTGEEVEHLGVATLVIDRADVRARLWLVAVGDERAGGSRARVVEPRAEIFRLERPGTVVAHEFKAYHVLPGALQHARVGVDRVEGAGRAVADVATAAEPHRCNLGPVRQTGRLVERRVLPPRFQRAARQAEVEQFAALVLEDGKVHEPTHRHAAAIRVGKSEGVRRILELAYLPGEIPLFVVVQKLDAGQKAVIEWALEGIHVVRPLHEVEPAAACEMLVAERILLVANSHGAEQRDLAHLQPEIGDGCDRAGVALRGKRLVVDVEFVGEVVFRGPVVHLVHSAFHAEPGPPQVDRVGERRIEPSLIRRLRGASARRKRDRIHLRPAADLDAKVFVARFGLKAVLPGVFEGFV